MILMEKIKSIWSEISPEKGSTIARRADPSHPLDFFVGYDETQNMQLMLLAEELPNLPKSSQQVLVRANQRTDKQYAICFILTNPSLREIFISLCWDIMACTYYVHDKKSGIASAIKRFSMWQILLARGLESRMSDSAVRGLLGELTILKKICIPKYGKNHAVTGWVGPLQADRDFEYEDGWLEVKATSLSKDTVSISSFDQLDVDRPGSLIICRLEKTSVHDPHSITLNALILSMEEALSDEECALQNFYTKLALNGYDRNDERADEAFIVHNIEVYSADDNFPRIRRSQLPTAIGNGEYTLNISALQTWRAEQEASYAEL